MYSTRYLVVIVCSAWLVMASGCNAQETSQANVSESETEKLYHNDEITVGAERLANYLPFLQGMRVGLVVNQTSMVGRSHLVDTLFHYEIDVRSIFGPEHGFRGKADDGANISDGVDAKTGIPIISLYGAYAMDRKPSPEQLENIDILIFDIQDVGARFYTFVSTMHYIMEAAAEQNIRVIILDRPNPNGHYVDGPVLDTAYSSFVGMHPVPIVHGMTVGEYAMMINGEGWLKNGIQCELFVIRCEGYDHNKYYELPIKPSPNLPNMRSIYLYPALCLFEGTNISVGRGTTKQFQVLGAPGLNLTDTDSFSFTPIPMPGASNPPLKGLECHGIDLSGMDVREARTQNMAPSIYTRIFKGYDDPDNFFKKYFTKLSGGTKLQKAIARGATESELEAIYTEGLAEFKEMRKKYLLYPDFE